jgi:hypothetical protein
VSKKRFIILSTLILSFPIAYKLLTPMPMTSPMSAKQMNIKVAKKKAESSTETATKELKKSNISTAPPPAVEATKPTATEATTSTQTVKPKVAEIKKTSVKSEVAQPSAVTTAPIGVNQKAEAILAKAPTLNPKVLKLALTAYTNAHKIGVKAKRNILTIIDYSKPSDHKRLWVIDLNKNAILYNTFAAHGKNTGDRMAKSFSNKPNSKSSSIGLFVTKETYHGAHGLSLRIHGLDKGFNDNALKRAVVIHGASYVNEYVAKANGRIGRSWGCPAVPYALSTPIINTIKGGTLVFSYAPGLMYEVKSKFLKA